ncbi:MAG: hypothetical protein JW751_10685 [Polyangiaceae bacterium]|nr:hypothetical protein [Polyangiaceae bacterium]
MARVGERPQVDEDALEAVDAGRVDPTDQRPFVVALTTVDLDAKLGGETRQGGVDLGERQRTVDLEQQSG